MARTTLHNIYLLKCTSCFLDFESQGSAKEYPKGRPLCVSCWDTKQERICDTHGVYHCKACKRARDEYRHSRRPKDSSHVGSKIEARLASKEEQHEFDKKNPWTEFREKAGLATESGPDPVSLQSID